jgi:hypothetical protein
MSAASMAILKLAFAKLLESNSPELSQLAAGYNSVVFSAKRENSPTCVVGYQRSSFFKVKLLGSLETEIAKYIFLERSTCGGGTKRADG